MAAVICKKEISAKLGGYYSTFGGNPVSCSSGLAVLVRLVRFHSKEDSMYRGALYLGSKRTCSGLSYKHFTMVNYDSRVVPDWRIPHIMTLES